MARSKARLDILLVERELAASRSKAAAMIMAGEVFVDGELALKAGAPQPRDAKITLKAKARYVSRGGLKLEAALESFAIDPRAKVCADIGASTGGFTDCLLQQGAAKVYAVDVGRGLLDYRLRQDERVHVLENVNARYLDSLGELVDLVVIDVAFISLRLILPAAKRVMKARADAVALVKPQFEAGRAAVGKGGIVRDRAVHRGVLNEVAVFAASLGFSPSGVIRSPITGAKGNVEYLLWLRQGAEGWKRADIERRIDRLTSADR